MIECLADGLPWCAASLVTGMLRNKYQGGVQSSGFILVSVVEKPGSSPLHYEELRGSSVQFSRLNCYGFLPIGWEQFTSKVVLVNFVRWDTHQMHACVRIVFVNRCVNTAYSSDVAYDVAIGSLSHFLFSYVPILLGFRRLSKRHAQKGGGGSASVHA